MADIQTVKELKERVYDILRNKDEEFKILQDRVKALEQKTESIIKFMNEVNKWNLN